MEEAYTCYHIEYVPTSWSQRTINWPYYIGEYKQCKCPQKITFYNNKHEEYTNDTDANTFAMEDDERELTFTEHVHLSDGKEVKRTYRVFIEDKKNNRFKILDIDEKDMTIVDVKKD